MDKIQIDTFSKAMKVGRTKEDARTYNTLECSIVSIHSPLIIEVEAANEPRVSSF